MPASTSRPRAHGHATNERHPEGDDSWVDQVADEVQALLRVHGLEMELCVWYDPVAEYLHAVGFDGSAARYFRSLSTDRVSKEEIRPSSLLFSSLACFDRSPVLDPVTKVP